MKKPLFCLMLAILGGCASERATELMDANNISATQASATKIHQRTKTDAIAETPQKPLAAGEVRVTLVVLPGDALVEVDKVPVRRRNGLIEFVGNVGDEHRVEVFMDAANPVAKTVILEATGASPAIIDAIAENQSKTGPAKNPVVFDINE